MQYVLSFILKIFVPTFFGFVSGSQFLYESFPLLVKQPMQDCSSNQFTCDDGSLCIDQEWKCDEEKDCEDGSDEKDCPGRNCKFNNSNSREIEYH